MPRTDIGTVLDGFETELDEDALQYWISIAENFVDQIENANTDLGTEGLKNLETLVTQHLATAQDPRMTEASLETAEIDFSGEYGMHFESSKYGQAAMMLDDTGTLDPEGDKQKANFRVLEGR